MQQGISPLIHYLDGFLTMGPAESTICHDNFATIQRFCQELGIPLALDKLEGPSQSLTFLGIDLDTVCMEARLLEDKLTRIRALLLSWLRRKKSTKREILSLVRLLQHASKVVRPGTTFMVRMYSTAARVEQLHYFTRLNKELRSDLCWWHIFINQWNGLSFLCAPSCTLSVNGQGQTDALGSLVCGTFYSDQWFQYLWPPEWLSLGIMAKELVPIIISCAV